MLKRICAFTFFYVVKYMRIFFPADISLNDDTTEAITTIVNTNTNSNSNTNSATTTVDLTNFVFRINDDYDDNDDNYDNDDNDDNDDYDDKMNHDGSVFLRK